MTTQVRRSLKARKADYERALLGVARSIAPRNDFLIEPILRDQVPDDPDGEYPPHEAWLFVVNGSEAELRAFYRDLARAALELTEDDPKLRWQVGIEAILPNEAASWLSTRAAS